MTSSNSKLEVEPAVNYWRLFYSVSSAVIGKKAGRSAHISQKSGERRKWGGVLDGYGVDIGQSCREPGEASSIISRKSN